MAMGVEAMQKPDADITDRDNLLLPLMRKTAYRS